MVALFYHYIKFILRLILLENEQFIEYTNWYILRNYLIK